MQAPFQTILSYPLPQDTAHIKPLPRWMHLKPLPLWGHLKPLSLWERLREGTRRKHPGARGLLVASRRSV